MICSGLTRRAIPGAAVVTVVGFVANGDRVSGDVEPVVFSITLALCGVVGLLAVVFRRVRFVEAALVLAVATLAARAFPGRADDGGLAGFVQDSTAVLLPISLMWIACQRERAALSEGGSLRLIGVAALPALPAYAWATYQESVIQALATPLPPVLAHLTSRPALATAAFGIAGVAVAIRAIRGHGPLEISVGWILAVGWLAMGAHASGPAIAAYLGGGLLLAVGLVQALFALAYLDPLTGLPSRRAWDEALATAHGRYAIAMFDVDHFKVCNDTHGHQVGDQVLRMVAARLASADGRAKTFRYGGEEFAVLFPGCTAQEAAHHVETMRNLVAETPFLLRGPRRPAAKPDQPSAPDTPPRHLKVTVSAGVAEHTPGMQPGDAVRIADEALYRAKASGRNRIEVS